MNAGPVIAGSRRDLALRTLLFPSDDAESLRLLLRADKFDRSVPRRDCDIASDLGLLRGTVGVSRDESKVRLAVRRSGRLFFPDKPDRGVLRVPPA